MDFLPNTPAKAAGIEYLSMYVISNLTHQFNHSKSECKTISSQAHQTADWANRSFGNESRIQHYMGRDGDDVITAESAMVEDLSDLNYL